MAPPGMDTKFTASSPGVGTLWLPYTSSNVTGTVTAVPAGLERVIGWPNVEDPGDATAGIVTNDAGDPITGHHVSFTSSYADTDTSYRTARRRCDPSTLYIQVLDDSRNEPGV